MAPAVPASASGYSHCIEVSNSVTAVSTLRPGVWKRAIIELLNDAGGPLANFFLTVEMKGMSSGPSQSE